MRWAAPRARVGAGCESGQHSGPADGAVDEPPAQAGEYGSGDQGAGGEDQLPFEGPAGVPEDVVGDGHRNSGCEAGEHGNAEGVAAVAGQGEDEFGHDALAQARASVAAAMSSHTIAAPGLRMMSAPTGPASR